MRLKAAIALSRIDQTASDKIFKELARTSKIGNVRIDAVLELPQHRRPEYFAAIVQDHREHEDIRCAAGVEAMDLDHRVGRQLLSTLAQSRISRRMQNHITSLLR